MKLFGLENAILNSFRELTSLLAGYFPHISSPQWEITPLAGLSGGSYLLRAQFNHHEIKLVARANGAAQSAIYVDRRKEARVLRQLRDDQLAPTVIASNASWLVLSWLEGASPSAQLFLSTHFQRALAGVIAKLHRAPLLKYRLQLRNEIAHYGQLIDKKRYSPRWKKRHQYFLSAQMPKLVKLAPAHMDIHCDNVVVNASGQIALLDWEYAANTDIAFSLETYFQFNHLTPTQQSDFLSFYCEEQGAYRDRNTLKHRCGLWEPWVKYMTLMWYEVQWQTHKQSQYLSHANSLRQYFDL